MSQLRVWGLMCPGSREEVTRARRWTRDVLSDHPRADDAELIVSELSTNALTHTTSGNFHITLTLTPQTLAISVTDSGGRQGTTPRRTHADPYDTHGRGLSIVMTLARRLDITGNEHGRTVTAELHTAPQPGVLTC